MKVPSLLFASLLLSACALNLKETQMPSVAESGGEYRIAPSDAINVTPLPKSDSDAGAITYKNPQIWSRVFIGQDNALGTFTLKHSQITMRTAALGFAIRYGYEIDRILHYKDADYPISAGGNRAAGVALASAVRQAVEFGVIDAGRACKAIIRAVDQTKKGQ